MPSADGRAPLPAVATVALLSFFPLTGKPVQYVYHYLVPFTFALATLAIALGRHWDQAIRWPAFILTTLSVAAFAWFYPALSAASLPNAAAEARFNWLPGWERPKRTIAPPTADALLRFNNAEACLDYPQEC